MKRLVDIALSLSTLLILFPVFFLAGLLVVFESGLPVFFKHERIGRNRQPFGMFKFRSMAKNAASIGPYFTTSDDPRITRVGRVLRRTSIDELPQLINVLLGDMSLVGPRPDVAAQRSLYTEADWVERCSVRPGITGLAQAVQRSDGTQESRLALDLQYVRERSLWFDLKIMWLTLTRLSGKGAN